MRYLFLSTGFVFSSLLISCFVLLNVKELSFFDSFFPEVFGFSLDGFILFSIMSFIQFELLNKKTEKYDIQKKQHDMLDEFVREELLSHFPYVESSISKKR